MEFLPLFLDIRKQRCLLIGGGQVALRKARLLLRAGADLRVVAPDIDAGLADMVSARGGELRYRQAELADLDDCALLFAASSDVGTNRRLATAAKARRIPVNVADDREYCSFILPSIVDRSPVLVAVSSSGCAPLLSRKLRTAIEMELPGNYGELASFLGAFRDEISKRLPATRDRRRFWEDLLDGPVPELVLAGRDAQARELLHNMLANDGDTSGEVWLVGAGPGDPDLLTLRALRLMQKAEVVLYDRLVSDGVMSLVRSEAERIHVGKRRAEHLVPQAEISELLITHARRGKRVLRLKGGDPFLFGRGGEEIETLAAAHIPFQVVPGITAATGCAAYAGIPLTHRDHAQSVRFLTGHLKNDRVNLDWRELVQPQQTLVFYMGSTGLEQICEGLITHGLDAMTPAALIERGTTPHQGVVCATLATLPIEVRRRGVTPPALIIVGQVVSLREKLDWFSPSGA